MAVRRPSRAAGKPRNRDRARVRSKPGPRAKARARPGAGARTAPGVRSAEAQIAKIRTDLARAARAAGPARWNANPEDVRRSVMKLVLSLVELIRQLLERQAIRRMDEGTLSAHDTEAVGLALMRLEETVRDLAAQVGLTLDELNLDLGPIGRLT